MSAPKRADWEAAVLKTLYGLTHGKPRGRITEIPSEKLYAAVKKEMARDFCNHYNKGSVTQALNRLEGEGLLVSRTQSPKRDGKKPKKVWGQVQHAHQYSLSEDGIRDARVASGLPAAEDAQAKGATAKAGKGAGGKATKAAAPLKPKAANSK